MIVYVLGQGRRLSSLICMAAALLPLLTACAVGQQKSEEQARAVVKSILVLPFEAEPSTDGREQFVTCPVCGSSYESGPIEENAAEVLTRILFAGLKDEPSIVLLTPGQSRGLWAEALSDSLDLPLLGVLQKIGRRAGYGAVLYGRVFRYREREGRAYSVQKPASVALDLHLISAADGTILWKGRFDETQTSLTDNILNVSKFLRRGFKWLTAEELAGEGMKELLKSLEESWVRSDACEHIQRSGSLRKVTTHGGAALMQEGDVPRVTIGRLQFLRGKES